MAGIDVLRRPDLVRRVVGCVAQSSDVDVNATGRENMVLQGRLYDIPGCALEERVEWASRAPRSRRSGRRVTHTYSGGMQRKLDVAMGLVHRPEALFWTSRQPASTPRPEPTWGPRSSVSPEKRGSRSCSPRTISKKRTAWRAAWRSSTRARSWRRARPTNSKVSLTATRWTSSCRTGDQRARRAALAPVVEVRDVVIEKGRLLHARAKRRRAAPVVLQALEAQGVPVASVTVARPSLDDVYLKYTGRRFEEADAAAEVTR